MAMATYIPVAGRSSLGKSTCKAVVVRIDAAAAGLFTVNALAEEARKNARAMEGDFMVTFEAQVWAMKVEAPVSSGSVAVFQVDDTKFLYLEVEGVPPTQKFTCTPVGSHYTT